MSTARLRQIAMLVLVTVVSVGAACGGCDDTQTGGFDGRDVDSADIGLDVISDSVSDVQADGGGDTDQEDVDPGCQTTVCDGVCCESGQECVADQCMDPCEGTRCGESLGLCCAGAEVCIFEGCHVPGDACTSSFECPDDQYCEQTLGSCLPREAADDSCTWRPPVGQFTPSSESHFAGVEHNGQLFPNSLATPTVADIDADGLPEVAVLMYRGGLQEALVAVLNGEDMSLLAYAGVGQVAPNTAGLAVGNIDPSTPELEIAALRSSGGLITFKYDATNQTLTEWWSTGEGAIGAINSESAPAIADIDGDGSAEVILGFSVVGADGQIWNGINEGPAGGHGTGFSNIAVVDIDGEVDANGLRDLEIVAGNRVLKRDGTYLWDVSDTVPDGFTAVGDFGADGVPEVVTVASGDVYVLSGDDGSVVFGPYAIPGDGQGGPPTIADFDGDGHIEFAAAGRGFYTVYDMDCVGAAPDVAFCASGRDDGILWSAAVQDLSSSRTGSSVFDFEGDGKAEVVYNDECFLRVLDGTDGTVLFEQANSTRTGSENPIVVDVDADFNAEIVVVANNDQIARDNCEQNYTNYPVGGTSGVFVYGDANNNWVPTRGIWNQHSYHITNILDDGSIPAQEPVHFGSNITNSFRLNVQPDGLFNAPDLTVESIETQDGVCAANVTVDVAVTVKNDGSLGVAPGVTVEVGVVHDGSRTVIGTVQTTQRLLPGQSETVTVSWAIPQDVLADGFDLDAQVDSTDSFNECVEDNNGDSLTPDPQDFEFGALAIEDLQINDTACDLSGTLTAIVTVRNQGEATLPANIPVLFEAVWGSNVNAMGTVETTAALAPGESEQLQLIWTVSGGYVNSQFDVRATIDPNAQVHPCSSGETVEMEADCLPSG